MTKRAKTTTASATLAELREQMGAIDTALVELLARRVALARRAGARKRAAGLAMLDARREAQVISAAARHARRAGLPEEDVRNIFWQVMAMSRRVQLESPT
jgi:chorismate mutase